MNNSFQIVNGNSKPNEPTFRLFNSLDELLNFVVLENSYGRQYIISKKTGSAPKLHQVYESK